MKNKLIWLVAVAAALTMAFGLTACSGGSSESADEAQVEAEQAAEGAGEAQVEAEQAAEGAVDDVVDEMPIDDSEPISVDIELSADELASPSVSIAYGDFEGMQALSSDIQNGNMIDEVVEIDGEILHFGEGMSYSIVEPGDGQSVGTTLVIVGLDESEYPADGTHVKVVGKVMPSAESGAAFEIYTLPDFVQPAE